MLLARSCLAVNVLHTILLDFDAILSSPSLGHVLKMVRYKEDEHGPCARMTP